MSLISNKNYFKDSTNIINYYIIKLKWTEVYINKGK